MFCWDRGRPARNERVARNMVKRNICAPSARCGRDARDPINHLTLMKPVILLLVIGVFCSSFASPAEPGLLFYLSWDHEFTADYAAGGDPQPNFLSDVNIISDGA